MPLSNHLSRRLDDIEDSQRSRLIISSFRPEFVRHRNSPHHAEKCVPARAACLCSRAPTGAGSSRILRPGFPFPVRPRLGQQLLPAATAALELDVKRGPEVGASSFSPGTAVMRHDDVLKGHDSSGTRRRNAGGALTVIIFSQWGDGCSVLHRPRAAAPHHVSRTCLASQRLEAGTETKKVRNFGPPELSRLPPALTDRGSVVARGP